MMKWLTVVPEVIASNLAIRITLSALKMPI